MGTGCDIAAGCSHTLTNDLSGFARTSRNDEFFFANHFLSFHPGFYACSNERLIIVNRGKRNNTTGKFSFHKRDKTKSNEDRSNT